MLWTSLPKRDLVTDTEVFYLYQFNCGRLDWDILFAACCVELVFVMS